MTTTSRSAAADESPADRVFHADLVRTLPHLRAFARGLCGRPDRADDLVQETAIKAWAARDRFTPGTNFRAWTFAITCVVAASETDRGDGSRALAA